MKLILIPLTALLIFTSSCGSQDKQRQSADQKQAPVGDYCENCESIYESPVPFESLNWVDTLPDFNDPGTQIELSGVIYKSDGVTPAENVVLYVYHTDQSGYYPKKGDETGWAKLQGYIRGWVKTNEKGEYKLYTLRPARYPTGEAPAHIHAILKEPDKNEYWIEDYVFDDDKLVDDNYRKNDKRRGGMGIISLAKNEKGILGGKRDIILGKDIPNYHD